MPINTDSKTFTAVVTQLGHFGWGSLILLNALLFTGHLWLAFAVLSCWVIPKEYIFDLTVEANQSFWDSTMDASMYYFGAISEVLLLRHFPLLSPLLRG